MSGSDLNQKIETIVDAISSITGRRANEIRLDQPFLEMGIESLQAVQIIASISNKIGRELEPTLLFDYPTVSRLAAYLSMQPRTQTVAPAPSRAETDKIAIIGMSCRFPGANSLEEFWDLLRSGTDAITAIPESRNQLRSQHSPNWGGFISDVDQFDNEAFGIPASEAERMDPQQRILLETAWHAIEDSGYSPSQLNGTRTGVFVGISSGDYSLLGIKHQIQQSVFDATGNAHSIASNRISYLMNFSGPSVSMDTACSSSLVAIHQACLALKNYEADLALAGGVNVMLASELSIAFTQAQMLSPDGRCKTFSDQANGYVRGEGVGVVVLKRLEDAKRDGDRIWGIILGTAVNQDGKSSGLTAPNGPAQEAVITQALAAAKVSPKDIGYIEAHGTGTPLGDPIEYNALARVFASSPNVTKLGSVKSNIGHLEAAAGVAGLIKSVLALSNNWIPKSLNCENLNPKLNASTRLEVASRGCEWSGSARKAGISSFGFGGTNAHVIIEEGIPQSSPTTLSTDPIFISASGTTPESARKFLKDLKTRVAETDDKALSALGNATVHSRSDLPYRIIVYGSNKAEIVSRINAAINQNSGLGWTEGRPAQTQAKFAFIFSDQSFQSFAVAGQLYKKYKSFQTAADDCCEEFDRFFPESLLPLLCGQKPFEPREPVASALRFTYSYALLKLLEKDFALQPDRIVGSDLTDFKRAIQSAIENKTVSAEKLDRDGLRINSSDIKSVEDVYQKLSELHVKGLHDARRWRLRTSGTGLPKTVLEKKKFWALPESGFAAKPVEVKTANVGLSEAEILLELRQAVGRLLNIPANDLNPNQPLLDLGADSLLILDAVQSIKEKYGVTIAISDIFQEITTLSAMARFIVEKQSSSVFPIDEPDLNLQDSNAQAVHSKKGVLGNFASTASTEDFQADDEKKNRYLEKLIREFNKKTAKTKAHTQKYRKVLADNRVSAGFRPNLKEIVYPLICKQARGSRFTDFDGNEYIDFTMGFGVNLFGHSPEFIETAVREQIELGMCLGPQSVLAGGVAELICELTGQERTAFCNSGTEAVMTAIRLARAATKRKKLVIFDGSYHGHFDGVLARALNEFGQSLPVAPGVTKGFVDDVLVLEYGTDESLGLIRTYASQLAAVLVEPVQSRFPELQPGDFLKELREITTASDTALIFDEVITGFRVHPGGAQAHFGVRADIATYGKILGGGLPIGAVSGKAKFIDPIDGGEWNFGDASMPRAEMTFFAGTFSKHPLAMAAAEAVLRKMKNEGLKLTSELTARTQKLANELNTFFTAQKLNISVKHFSSLFRFKANANLDMFFYNLNFRGIYVWEGRNLFLSTAHSEADVAEFIRIVKETTLELIENGFLKPKTSKQIESAQPTTTEKTWPLLPSQQRFKELLVNGKNGEAAAHICISVKMKGDLKPDILERSLEKVVRHYDAFRLRVDIENGQQWFSAKADCPFEIHDVSQAKIPWDELTKLLREHGKQPFDLKKDSPVRFYLYPVVEETAVFAMVAHHMAFDGWSISQFIEDVADTYGAEVDGTEFKLASALSFREFLNHPSKFGEQGKVKKAKDYWESRWRDRKPHYIRWPEGKSSPDLKGERVVFDIEHSLYTNIKKAAREHKLPPYILLLAAFGKLLALITNEKQFVVGAPAANRDLPGAEQMVGNCANLLPLELNVQNESATALLAKVKAEYLQDMSNMAHPYEELLKKVGAPLFNVSFNLEPTSDLPDFGDVSLFMHPFPITASEFDLTMNLTDLEYFYHGEADFKSALFTDAQVIRWADEYVKILKAMMTELLP